MTDLIEQIHQDHITMAHVLDVIEAEIGRLAGEEDVDMDLLVECMRYMINYSDTVHHPKEDAMFHRLSEVKHSLAETIGHIFEQHQELARAGSEFSDLVKNAALGMMVSRADIAAAGESYITMLREHMNLEESKLLADARISLSDADKTEIEKEYAHFRDPLVSKSLEQEYSGLLRALSVE